MQHNKSAFIGRLESMRGVAALFVAICHSFIWCIVFGQPVSVMKFVNVHDLEPTIARIVVSITNGGAWVDFFFVLSGFVLAASLSKDRLSAGGWARFMIKRALRIMPAFLVSLAFIAVLLWIRQRFDLFPDAFDSWQAPWHFTTVGAGRFLVNAAFLTNELNPPSWTLRVEMIAALGLPMAYALARAVPAVLSVAAGIGIAAVASYVDGQVGAVLITYNMFLLGILCALYGRSIAAVMGSAGLSVLAILSFVVICAAHLPYDVYDVFGHAVIGFASAALVLALASDKRIYGFGWLDTRPLRFLGRISFSFYLLHYVFLYAVTLPISAYDLGDPFRPYQVYPLAAMSLSALVSIALCIPASWLMYRFVELPSITVGRWAASLKESQEHRNITPQAQ